VVVEEELAVVEEGAVKPRLARGQASQGESSDSLLSLWPLLSIPRHILRSGSVSCTCNDYHVQVESLTEFRRGTILYT
jgi:hypothetical protein